LLLVVSQVVDFAVATLLFAALFKVLPDAKIAWRDVWVGAGVTALLFVLGKFALGFYLGRSDIGSAFGVAGSLALILVWIYYSGLILLLGAEFTQVWARSYGTEIQPADGAVRVVERTFSIRDGRPVSDDEDNPKTPNELEGAANA
jgi:membrane protein